MVIRLLGSCVYLFGFSVRGLGAIDILRKGRVTVGEGWFVIIFRYTEIGRSKGRKHYIRDVSWLNLHVNAIFIRNSFFKKIHRTRGIYVNRATTYDDGVI